MSFFKSKFRDPKVSMCFSTYCIYFRLLRQVSIMYIELIVFDHLFIYRSPSLPQLKTALVCAHVRSAWSSRTAVGAVTPATQAGVSVWRGRTGGPWRASHPNRVGTWCWSPDCAPGTVAMTGASSPALVSIHTVHMCVCTRFSSLFGSATRERHKGLKVYKNLISGHLIQTSSVGIRAT